MTFFRATGVSEVLVTARYLMKTRRLHRQRLKQSDEELAVGILMLSQAETAEDMGVEEDESHFFFSPPPNLTPSRHSNEVYFCTNSLRFLPKKKNIFKL